MMPGGGRNLRSRRVVERLSNRPRSRQTAYAMRSRSRLTYIVSAHVHQMGYR